MASFGSSKRSVFKPTAYGSSRRPRRIPRWLVLMLTGVVLGSGGLLFLQKNYGPPRLTVEQSEQLHNDINSANLDKQRLQSQLNQQTHDLTEAKTSLAHQSAQLKQAQAQAAKSDGALQLFADAMPPDPRGTSPGIRSATFKNNAGQLDYQVLVMQDDNKKATRYQGDMELSVAGRYPNGKTNTIKLPLISVDLQQYAFVRGSAQLPDNFTARVVTIRITDQNSKHISATRTLHVLR